MSIKLEKDISVRRRPLAANALPQDKYKRNGIARLIMDF